MHILVVGGAGYIGSHVCREFLDAGHKVLIFDNMSTGQKENLIDEAQFVQGDICNPEDLQTLFTKQRFDGIVHLAALKAAGESMLPEHLGRYATNNITGTINLLNAARSAGVGAFVFSSSAAVYGQPDYLPIDEAHPCNPENFYGFTKLEIERILHWYDQIGGVRFAALRYFNAAGYDPLGRVRGLEQNPANLLPIVMEVACGMREKIQLFGDDYNTSDGTCIRDYVHVSDLARAHVRAMQHICQTNASVTVNLGSEVGISVQQMLDYAREITGRKIPADIAARRPGDAAHLVASSAQAQQVLGWKAKLSDVQTLIDSTWKMYCAHGLASKRDH